jgi:hypothetical protein
MGVETRGHKTPHVIHGEKKPKETGNVQGDMQIHTKGFPHIQGHKG